MSREEPRSGLYVVATPIGNLADITLRAVDVLQGVDVIAAEDTRTSRVLLERHGISTRLVPLHEHNETKVSAELVARIQGGESVALISDAGTPLISDPGFRLVSAAVEAGLRVVTIPGPSAVTAALSVSGLPTARFVFEGFLPAKREARRQRLRELAAEPRTLVLFESAHRIVGALADLRDQLGTEREVALCRELTKKFETVRRAPAGVLADWVASDADQQKGEFVLVVAGNPDPPSGGLADAIRMARALVKYLPASQAARVAASFHGVSRRDVYKGFDSGTQ